MAIYVVVPGTREAKGGQKRRISNHLHSCTVNIVVNFGDYHFLVVSRRDEPYETLKGGQLFRLIFPATRSTPTPIFSRS